LLLIVQRWHASRVASVRELDVFDSVCPTPSPKILGLDWRDTPAQIRSEFPRYGSKRTVVYDELKAG
jgi:hypothetical protein